MSELIFIGVAGTINNDLNVGDFVIDNSLVQHDLSARPIMSRFVIPLLGKIVFVPPVALLEYATAKIKELDNSSPLSDLLSLEQKQLFLKNK